jgi:hypothetical protein
MLDKNKLVESLKERMSFYENQNNDTQEFWFENCAKIEEIKQLIYVINKGCFDAK